ncbi:hypothetical protein SAMN05421877_106177 [Sphingobacterium lactis]|uniref:Uncharacterized protein n=1 Tax=Sphingobacterium lactis TaxID=797291 RepID=A0A1H5Z078_9SPHI|nr:hypothetical protein SAMN05421877_106177 [Sphingobacterium lactis]
MYVFFFIVNFVKCKLPENKQLNIWRMGHSRTQRQLIKQNR